jgi:hypothetical protein
VLSLATYRIAAKPRTDTTFTQHNTNLSRDESAALEIVDTFLLEQKLRPDQFVLTHLEPQEPSSYTIFLEAISEHYVYGSHYTFEVANGQVVHWHGGK